MPQIIKKCILVVCEKKVPVHLSGFSQNTTFLSLEKYFKYQEKCLKTLKLGLAKKFESEIIGLQIEIAKEKISRDKMHHYL